ncbi:MAG TPA: endolysin, partial [Subdoligranulum sp.]|nr:endolysin [Subdoligranulum sp.]
GSYAMWQYTGSGSVSGISGACDLDRSYKDFLPEIRAGGYNNYGVSGPSMETVSGKRLVVFNARCEYFNTANFNDVVGYLPLGNYCVVKQSTRKYNGYDWVIFRYQGTEYWTAVIGDRNRVEDCNCDCN